MSVSTLLSVKKMVHLKKALLGIFSALIILLSLGIVTALYSSTGDLNVDATTLSVPASYLEQVSGAHNTQVTGVFNLTTVSTVVTLTSIGITSGADLSDGAGHTIPNANIAITPATPTIAAGGSQEFTYTVDIPNLQYAGAYTGEITATDGTNTVTFDLEVTVSTLNQIVVTESSIAQSAILGNSATYTITVSNTGNVDESVAFGLSEPALNWKKTQKLSATPTVAGGSVATNSTQTYTFVLSSDITTDKRGIYTAILNMTAGSLTDTAAIQFTTIKNTDDGIARLDNYDNIDDLTGDDDVWRPGDTIELEDVELANLASDYGLEDVELELTLIKTSNGKKYADEKIDVGEIDSDDTVEETIELQIPYDAPQGEYIIKLEMKGENSDLASEKHTTTVFSEIIDVERDSRHVIVESMSLLDEDLFCGNTARLDVKITNIGTRDLDKDDDLRLRVKVDSFSFEEYANINDLDEDDSLTFSYDVEIPSDAKKGNYFATAVLTYKSDDDDEGIDSTYTMNIGECSNPTSQTSTPNSDSEPAALFGDDSGSGKPGEAIKYSLTVTNSGDETSDFSLEILGASDWATITIEPSGVLRLAPGQTAGAFVYLTPHSAVDGTKTATVNVKSAGETVATKTLSAAVSPSGATVTTFTQSTLSDMNAENVILYASVMMNIVLIMVMIGVVYTLKNPKPKQKDKGRRD